MRVVGGPRKIEGGRDEESHRTYKVTYRVKGNTGAGVADYVANALQCPGLPQYGDQWLVDADLDLWAFCRYPVEVRPVIGEGEPNTFWDLTFTYTTKPDKALCLENQIEDPLLKPPKLSGQSVKYTEEAVQDRFGNFLVNSAWEQFRGPQVEFDANRPRVHIEMPVPQLLLSFVAQFVDCVNAFPIWGCVPRTVKLSEFKWEKNYYGICFPYYTWIFDFDINAQTFDRLVLDEATKVLRGHWLLNEGPPQNLRWVLDGSPDPGNPMDFIRAIDYPTGNPMRIILDGQGLPAGVLIGTGTAVPDCSTCSTSTTPDQLVLTPLDGTFQGMYSIYSVLFDVALTATGAGSCTFLIDSGEGVTAYVVYYHVTGSNFVTIEVTFRSDEDVVPSVKYRALVRATNGKIDCSQSYTPDLIQGDENLCPLSVKIQPSGSPSPGPGYSGGPGFRYIQKYGEADFSLLGIPLIL